MSAYIVSKDDMNAALRVLYASGEAEAFGFADASQLGRHLFAMNIAAVSARYGGEDVNSLPGPGEDVVEQAQRVLPLARDNNDPTLVMACKQIMVAWLEGRLVEREFIALVDTFDPRN